MNKPLGVVLEHDSVKLVFMGLKVEKAIVRRCGNRYCPLLSATLKPNDDVFLQNIIVFECLVTRLEQVHVPDGSAIKDEVAEWAIIRPIAKAARDDRHDLPARCCHRHGQRHKGGIKIDGFNSGLTEKEAVI